MNVQGQEGLDANSWNLQISLGASIVNSNGTTGPMARLELLNSTNKHSFIDKSKNPFSVEDYERDYRLMFMEYPYQNYYRSKYSTERPYRSTVAGSIGLGWSRYTKQTNNIQVQGKNLGSDSLSLPANLLRYEIRYNLMPQKLTREFSQDYSNLTISLLYQFGSIKRD